MSCPAAKLMPNDEAYKGMLANMCMICADVESTQEIINAQVLGARHENRGIHK